MSSSEGLNVSRETMERLEIYAELLKKWTPRINLVSKSTVSDLWSRHFLDSAQIFDLAPDGITHWADFGSGGGFPGLVVAILAQGAERSFKMTLVESDMRKCAFLRNVVREVGVDVDVQSSRVENLPFINADVISARALADLDKLLMLSEPHLAQSGTMLFMKGKNWQAEVVEAQSKWNFDYQVARSKTSEASTILVISGVSRV